ncbi:MAG: phospholipase/carboxylesterase [Flavipsychrobacter sp.]|nr:phospholipase/carboxylesterase [Flavipsychrobacter sp.]
MKKVILTFCAVWVGTLLSFAQLQQDLALKYVVQQPTEKTAKTPVIILLHGYGSNEGDLFELRNVFPRKYLIISARAPYPVGTQGYQWFDLRKGDGYTEISYSRDLVLKLITQIVDNYKADPKQVYIMGFSQGAMMSYDIGLLNPDKVKGIAPLSGRLFAHLQQKIRSATPQLKQLKIFIAHGTADDRIKFAEGKAANEYLKNIGLKPEFHEYPGMGHSISNDVLKDLVKWLQ